MDMKRKKIIAHNEFILTHSHAIRWRLAIEIRKLIQGTVKPQFRVSLGTIFFNVLLKAILC
jgi:hypothetical protein